MPRAGIRCPVDGADISDQTCLACAAGCHRVPEPCHFTFEMLKGMMDESGRATAHLSATMLGGICARQKWLQQEHPWYLDPEKGYAAYRGTLGHLVMEQHPEPGSIVEQRFELVRPEWPLPVTGKIDKLHPGRRLISDFKTKPEEKNPPTKAAADHVMQLNVYRYLVMHGWPQERLETEHGTWEPGVPAGIAVDRLELVYWTFGWVRRHPAPILPDHEVEAHIEKGLQRHLATTIPQIPRSLDPAGLSGRPSTFCAEWCPVRAHCLAALTPDPDEDF